MVVSKPLIATGTSQFFRASATADWSSRTIFVSYFSVSPEGKKTDNHAHCTVKLGDQEAWLKEWSRLTYLIKSRIETLQSGVTDGRTHLIKKRMAYKLFSSVVEYDTKYQGMQEVLLDSEHLEASAKVAFQTTEEDGKFCFNPFWIDSLGHLAGFVMNGNDFVDSKVQVFVNHGWDSMRCAQDFSPSKQYRTYVRMQNIGGTMHSGDVYIFDEDVVVGVYQGVKVGLKKLDFLLVGES
jgi:naphtho-gamma-pyrone polyketide synthase